MNHDVLNINVLKETDTAHLAACLAEVAFPGMFISLDGDLGAGKTTFTQYFARSLGIKEIVNSPTFTLVREYEDGRLPLYHMDLYRLQAQEVFELGFDEYWYGSGVSVVEWAMRVADADLPAERLFIQIQLLDDGTRVWNVQAVGDTYRVVMQKLENVILDDSNQEESK